MKNLESVPNYEIYRTYMCDAKIRIVAIEKVFKRSQPTYILPSLDVEFCYLQVRRIIEALTFATLVRDQSRYQALRRTRRKTQKGLAQDIASDWNASQILKALEEINQHSLPIPIGNAKEVAIGQWHFDRQKLQVRHERLVDIYKRCSGFLHAKNPLNGSFAKLVDDQRKIYQKSPKRIAEDTQFLRNLLWKHV